jgi:hypothetical protein
MATIVERNLAVAIERGGGAFGRTMRAAVKDFLLGGQGVAWVRYEVEFGDDVDEATGQPKVNDEAVTPDYVHWRDFGCTAGARVWDEVTAVWRRSFLDREELIERFGDDVGKRVPLDNTHPGREDDEDGGKGTFAKASVYEIWDADERQTLWVHKGMDEPLDSKPYPGMDAGRLPLPAAAVRHADQRHADPGAGLRPIPGPGAGVGRPDRADCRAHLGAAAGRLRPGRHGQDVQRALDLSGEAQVIPVKSWAAFGGQKLADLIVWLPIQETVATLTALQQLREKVKQDAYEITGLSDILRGSTQASETATAQQIKAQWGSIRVRTRQQDVQRFAADLLERMAAAMVALFAPERLAEQANVQGMPAGDQQYVIPALQLLKGEAALTAYRVNVETDSTIEPDQQAEKASWTELLGGVAQFLQAFAPILQGIRQGAPQALPAWTAMGAELLLGAVRRFRAGPAMESSIEAAFEALGAAAAQAAQQQGPPPMSPGRDGQAPDRGEQGPGGAAEGSGGRGQGAGRAGADTSRDGAFGAGDGAGASAARDRHDGRARRPARATGEDAAGRAAAAG